MSDKKYWGSGEDRRNMPGFRGNSRKENQRQRLLVDLYGPERARLENEVNQRPEQHISEALKSILSNSKMDDRLHFSDLLEEWEKLVGEALATLCRPVAIDFKTLMISVDHASAMHVLERNLSLPVQYCMVAIDRGKLLPLPTPLDRSLCTPAPFFLLFCNGPCLWVLNCFCLLQKM